MLADGRAQAVLAQALAARVRAHRAAPVHAARLLPHLALAEGAPVVRAAVVAVEAAGAQRARHVSARSRVRGCSQRF